MYRLQEALQKIGQKKIFRKKFFFWRGYPLLYIWLLEKSDKLGRKTSPKTLFSPILANFRQFATTDKIGGTSNNHQLFRATNITPKHVSKKFWWLYHKYRQTSVPHHIWKKSRNRHHQKIATTTTTGATTKNRHHHHHHHHHPKKKIATTLREFLFDVVRPPNFLGN